MTGSIPIACTLDAASLRSRKGWIAGLNQRSLKRVSNRGLVLTLDYAPEAAEQVRELVREESTCCAFLRFRIADLPDAVRLTIEAPAEAGGNSDALFEPFLAGAGQEKGAACACSEAAPVIDPAAGSGSKAARAATTASTAALACAVCCVLPLMLPAAVAATFGGVFVWLESAYAWLEPVGLIMVVAAWLWVLGESTLRKRRPAGATLVILSLGSVSATLAMLWPRLEGPITTWLRG